jgi:hypothetical protein
LFEDAPILILDEPASSVDFRADRYPGAIERLMQGRTTLVIAHSGSTRRHCEAMRMRRIEGGWLAAFRPCVPAPGGSVLMAVALDSALRRSLSSG